MAKNPTIYVCTNLRMSGSSCSGQGAKNVLKALQLQADRVAGEQVKVEVKISVCMGYCTEGPNVKVMGGKFYHHVKPEDADKIVADAQKLSLNED